MLRNLIILICARKYDTYECKRMYEERLGLVRKINAIGILIFILNIITVVTFVENAVAAIMMMLAWIAGLLFTFLTASFSGELFVISILKEVIQTADEVQALERENKKADEH